MVESQWLKGFSMLIDDLMHKIKSREAVVGIVGLGYVGLPLGIAFAKVGFSVLGYDVDPAKVRLINQGKSYITYIADEAMAELLAKGGRATSSPEDLAKADAILICVPTPLSKHREPDMRYIVQTAEMLASVIRPGQLIVLESTTYPGTTRDVLLPQLEKTGLAAGRDFLLAYSPEREDPGSQGHSAGEIPKVVGGFDQSSLDAANSLYGMVVPRTVPVSSLEVAEATKLLENIFRCVNIALINELKQIFARMNIDIWEVVESASSKPFGFMPFYPGPGLGGHCIPIDPFYLTWKAREYGCSARFIELSGEINAGMPEYVVNRLAEELNADYKSIKGSKILLIGVAYKKNVDDVRESPAFSIIDLLARRGAETEYHDPYVPSLPNTRKYRLGMHSVELTAENVEKYDAVVIVTDHGNIDYTLLATHAKLILDTRNAMRGHGISARVAKA